MREVEKEIREHWFSDHQAILTKHGDLEVLGWKKPGTNIYYCRYVFDQNRIYISGDIGQAIFDLTWKATIHSFDDINLGYFYSKLSAFSDDKKDFKSEDAVKRLREWLNDLHEGGVEYDHEEMKELFGQARGVTEHWEWAEAIHKQESFISELDPDYWEWMYDCGDEIPIRIKGYLIGLKMASVQLRSRKIEGEIKP